MLQYHSGNFGGGREGAMMGQYNADSLADRGQHCKLQMLQQGLWSMLKQAAQSKFC